MRDVPLMRLNGVVLMCFALFATASIIDAGGLGDSREHGISSVNSSPEVWTTGEQFDRTGDSSDVLALFQGVVRVDRTGIDYFRELDNPFQIAKLQEALNVEANPILWFAYADKLRRLYVEKGMFPESLGISKKIFAQTGTVASGIEVINVCLAFHRTEEALSFVKHLESKFADDKEALTTIAIANCGVLIAAGKTETARGLVREIHPNAVKTPESFLQLAKVQAATRQHASSVKSLTRCFELTPPSVLPIMKADVENSPEFSTIASATQFKEAMATQSKQQEDCCPKARACSINNEKTVSDSRW